MEDVTFPSAQKSFDKAKSWLGNAFNEIENLFKRSNEFAGSDTRMPYNGFISEAKLVDKSRFSVESRFQQASNGEMSIEFENPINKNEDRSNIDAQKRQHNEKVHKIEVRGNSAYSKHGKCIENQASIPQADNREKQVLSPFDEKTNLKGPHALLSPGCRNLASRRSQFKYGQCSMDLEALRDANRQNQESPHVKNLDTAEKSLQWSRSFSDVCTTICRSKLQDFTSYQQTTFKSDVKNDEQYIGSLKMYLQHFRSARQLRVGLCFVEGLQTDNHELVVHVSLLGSNNKQIRKVVSKTVATESNKATFNEDLYIKTKNEYAETGQLEVGLCKLSKRLRRAIPIGKTLLQLDQLDLFFDTTVYAALLPQETVYTKGATSVHNSDGTEEKEQL